MKRIKVITIDGPAASGKGSLAISIANKFSFKLLDSGSLYRLFALFERRNIDHMEIVETIKNRVEFELTKDSQSIIEVLPNDGKNKQKNNYYQDRKPEIQNQNDF